jgi:putative restriction endonuclease
MPEPWRDGWRVAADLRAGGNRRGRVRFIYFLGIAPGRYQAMLPTFISGWDGKALKARVAFGAPDQETFAPPETALERRYALRAVNAHQHHRDG